jgi:hypothetical protein
MKFVGPSKGVTGAASALVANETGDARRLKILRSNRRARLVLKEWVD